MKYILKKTKDLNADNWLFICFGNINPLLIPLRLVFLSECLELDAYSMLLKTGFYIWISFLGLILCVSLISFYNHSEIATNDTRVIYQISNQHVYVDMKYNWMVWSFFRKFYVCKMLNYSTMVIRLWCEHYLKPYFSKLF